jgi:hypothetical protein
MLCGQYDILYVNLKNLGEVSEEKIVGKHSKKALIEMKQRNFNLSSEEVRQYMVSNEIVDNLSSVDSYFHANDHDAIADCVKHHEMILEFAKKLQDVYSIFASSKLLYSSECIMLTSLRDINE